MSRIPRLRPLQLVLASCGLTLASCGSGGGSAPKATSTSSVPPAPTTAAAKLGIVAAPASGPIGTTFQLRGTFQPQEKVAIEIDLPNGKSFKGQSHTATADGTVTASYRTTANDPPGAFQVKATGEHGDEATGQFEVTSQGAATTSRGRATSTTAHGATTTLRGATTTTRGQVTSTKKP